MISNHEANACCRKCPVTNNSCLHEQRSKAIFLWLFYVAVFVVVLARDVSLQRERKGKSKLFLVIPLKYPF